MFTFGARLFVLSVYLNMQTFRKYMILNFLSRLHQYVFLLVDPNDALKICIYLQCNYVLITAVAVYMCFLLSLSEQLD